MAEITASIVKELREETGCGMMDCKKALVECDGDKEKAAEYLREKGLSKAAKKAGRIAAEGIVYNYVNKNVGVVVEVNAETDFVAKNADFQGFVANIAKTIAEKNPADVEALLACEYPTGGSVSDELTNKIATIGENMNIRRFTRMEGTIASYTHDGGRIGVMVLLDAPENEATLELGKKLAMQIACYSPEYVAIADVPTDVVAHEKEVLKIQAMNEGKPENIAEKMVEGRIRKFYDGACLLEQAYIMDEDIKVSKHIDDVAKENGISISVKQFVRYEKGEGLEKRQDNFAEEIANLVK
ncbi:MAG: translation elongation factor Ts [Bacillota bacterium]|nr:translation elongation factor Ts [Bacillota bacterium]